MSVDGSGQVKVQLCGMLASQLVLARRWPDDQ